MARDGALPFSSFGRRLDLQRGAPVGSVVLVLVVSVLIQLIITGSVKAVATFVNPYALLPAGVVWCFFFCAREDDPQAPSCSAPQLAYVISLILRFTSGRSTTKGAFTLGRYSEPIAWVSIAWLAATLTIYVWPSKSPVTATTMNWAIACLAALSEFSEWQGVFLGWHRTL